MDKDEKKASSPMKILRRKADQNVSIKILTNKKTQIMRQSMRNLQLHMIHLSKSRDILTYFNVEGIS